jgi:hypothetical protein
MDYDDPTPAGVIRETWRWLPAWVVVLAVVALVGGGVTVAGSAFGWWLSAQNATHQAENTQNGYSNQMTLRQQVTSNFATLATIGTQIAASPSDKSLVAALGTQRAATAATICSGAAQVSGTPLPAQQAAWVTANCTDGTLSTASPDYESGQP